MQLYAYAKINWTLDILSRYPNGYHEMDMLMQPISLFDTVTLLPDNKLSLKITGSIPLPADDNNLCLRAARALHQYCPLSYGVAITLEKHIPIGAGMGGGSADCAAVLMGLNRLWDLGLTLAELCDIGATLGADVPFCLYGGLARAQGIGEKLTLFSCDKPYHLLIIKPDALLSTKKVFAAFRLDSRTNRPHTDAALRAIQSGDLMLLRASLGNVLTPVSEMICPDITSALNALNRYGAVVSFMTGSGNAVVGVYKSPTARDAAYQALNGTFNCYPARTKQSCVAFA